MMFTGIIEEIGTVFQITKGKHSAILKISAEKVLQNTKLGDSIAVNGVCLTVTKAETNCFWVDIMHETLNRSSLSKLSGGVHVNLERAVQVGGRFGGHFVTGHIDGIGEISHIQYDDTAIWYTIRTKPELMPYIVEKGSVAIDGISLTVARVTQSDFSISAIPHTVRQTILKTRKEGDTVNIETDIIGKYVEKLTETVFKQNKESKITMDFLLNQGF